MRIRDWSSDVCSSDLAPCCCHPRTCSAGPGFRRHHSCPSLKWVAGSSPAMTVEVWRRSRLHPLEEVGGEVAFGERRQDDDDQLAGHLGPRADLEDRKRTV